MWRHGAETDRNSKRGGQNPKRPNLIITESENKKPFSEKGLGRAMLNDFGRGANRMGSRLLSSS